MTVGVVAALRELVEEMEEVLSARANGAMGGGLAEWIGGLKGRFASPTVGFPGGSFGRDGGRGGGGGGVGLTDEGVAGRTGEEEPLFEPPAPDVGPGDETTARYVGGGGGGGVVRLPWLESLGEVTVSPPSSLGWVVSVFLGCSSSARTRGGGTERVVGSSVGGLTAGGVPALGAGAGGTLAGESVGGGEEAGGDASSFGAGGGEVTRGFLSSGVEGPERTGGAAGSSVGSGEVGTGGAGSSFGGGDVGRGGAGSSGGGEDVGKGGAGDSGGGGEAGNGGAGSSGGGGEVGRGGAGSFGRGGRSEDSSLKQTHVSPVSSPGGTDCSGPKMLSKSAIEGFLVELSASVDTSASSAEGGPVVGGEVGTFLGGRGGGASLFCSPKAVSKGGPNKAVVSSGTGVC